MRRFTSLRCASVARRWLALACLLAAPLAGAAEVPAAAPARIDIGVLTVLDGEDTQRLWQPLADGLARALPGHSVHLQVLDPDALDAAVAQRALHFVVTNPGHYVRLEARHGTTRIATRTPPETDDPAHTVGSAVVVRAGTPIPATLQSLRDMRVAAVAEDAFGGYQLVAREWLRNGLDAEAGAVQRVFTGFPMQRVADAVLAGRADAGILRTCVLEQLERTGRVPPGALVVVGARPDAPAPCRSSTPLYPGWAFAALASTPPDLGRSVLLALLGLPADAQGSRWSVPADYQRVHEVLRALQVEPYAFLRDTRPQALLGRYWYLLAGTLAVLLLGAAYMLHVELLVKRRTAELTHSLHEREQLARLNAQHQEALGHLSRLSILGELSAMLAHELNHPLATISNYAAGLRRRVARGNLAAQDLERALQDIAHESERAARVIGGVRALARKRVPEHMTLAPRPLVEQALALCAGGQPQPVRLVCPAAVQALRVRGDAQQLLQVLLNLLQNARDVHRSAAQAGAGEPGTIEVEMGVEEGCLSMAVRDHGPPLPPEALALLFTPFHTTKPDGLGLGLSISRSIAEAHGGALHARPVPLSQGGGMRMVLLLPLAHDGPHPAPHSPAPLCP